MAKPVALGADHGGFELKEAVKRHLEERGIEYRDFGTHTGEAVDYPDIALPPCDAVVKGECSLALLFCGTGVGISIAANKVNGIRACCCSDVFSAKYTRMGTTTPTPFAWAGAWWAPALLWSWWTRSWLPALRAGAMRAAWKSWPLLRRVSAAAIRPVKRSVSRPAGPQSLLFCEGTGAFPSV